MGNRGELSVVQDSVEMKYSFYEVFILLILQSLKVKKDIYLYLYLLNRLKQIGLNDR